MLRAHVILPWVLCTGLLAASAQAQVVRCQDPRTGQVTYTDGECSGGDKAREVQARKSAEELAQERAQAAEALERKQQRKSGPGTAPGPPSPGGANSGAWGGKNPPRKPKPPACKHCASANCWNAPRHRAPTTPSPPNARLRAASGRR